MAAASSSSSAGGGSPAHAPSPAGGGGGGGPYSHHHRSRFGDTTLTKVFVGGLAWETPSEGLREHFQGYGEILEAVVITDRETGRSKGYGFVIFRDPEAAQRAVQNPNPVIAGRRANCNIASMGPSRSAPSRGRGGGGGAGRGPYVPDQQPMGSPYRVPPSQMAPPQGATMFYPNQYGFWYPPDYAYQQTNIQQFYNSQMLQHYYPQLYAPQNSASGQPYQYMGYMHSGPGPRTVFSPMQQHARPLFQQPTGQMEASFSSGTSLPPNFRLQLPPHAVSRQSDNASEYEMEECESVLDTGDEHCQKLEIIVPRQEYPGTRSNAVFAGKMGGETGDAELKMLTIPEMHKEAWNLKETTWEDEVSYFHAEV